MQEKETDIDLINAVLVGQTAQYAVLVKRHQRFAVPDVQHAVGNYRVGKMFLGSFAHHNDGPWA